LTQPNFRIWVGKKNWDAILFFSFGGFDATFDFAKYVKETLRTSIAKMQYREFAQKKAKRIRESQKQRQKRIRHSFQANPSLFD